MATDDDDSSPKPIPRRDPATENEILRDHEISRLRAALVQSSEDLKLAHETITALRDRIAQLEKELHQ